AAEPKTVFFRNDNLHNPAGCAGIFMNVIAFCSVRGNVKRKLIFVIIKRSIHVLWLRPPASGFLHEVDVISAIPRKTVRGKVQRPVVGMYEWRDLIELAVHVLACIYRLCPLVVLIEVGDPNVSAAVASRTI